MTVSIISTINNLDSTDTLPLTSDLLVSTKCVLKYIDQHGEKNQAFDMLRALSNLSIDRLERGKEDIQFTAVNILAEAGISISESKAAGTRLSPVWKKLTEKILPEREQGLQDFARNEGLPFYAWPVKDKSDGGRPSEFWLELRTVSESETQNVEALADNEIAYIRELNPKPSWWAKLLLQNGYRLEGWRRWAFLIYGVGSILLAALSIALLWGLLWVMPTWSLRDFGISVFSTVFFIYACWITLRPFLRLLEWRIVMAPAGLVALTEYNVQMEIIREQVSTMGPSTIRLVRYASTCPQCKAKIEIEDGGKEFINRLVGRCKENPAEHVYSFDRFSCRGKNLRDS